MPTTVSKTELKGKMLAYFRRVEHLGEEIIVTSHGRPIARVVPIRPRPSLETLFGEARRVLKERGTTYTDEQLSEPMPTNVWSDLIEDPGDG